MNKGSLHETVASIKDELNEYGVELDNESMTTVETIQPIAYGEVRRVDVPIKSLKGKNTRKWFHIVIERFQHNGLFELVCYPL